MKYGTRYEYLPMPTRPDRGMERYDFASNTMLLCGVGGIPEDCGTKVGKLYFPPRLGVDDAVEVAPPSKNCVTNCQAQDRVRGELPALGFPFPVPFASRLL